MSAMATTIRVPVRTWQQKAILASMVVHQLRSLYEEKERFICGDIYDHLMDETATDRLIDSYVGEGTEIVAAERLLFDIRAVVPGPDAALGIPEGYNLAARLEATIDDLCELDVDSLLPHVEHPSRREMAAATIVAIDLRDELSGKPVEIGGAA
ncbi:MAG: hypothetical protein ACRDK7_11965 [Solirubrobacteraceae bacterium]